MNMKKKWLALLLAAAMVLSLCGCGGTGMTPGGEEDDYTNVVLPADEGTPEEPQEGEVVVREQAAFSFADVEDLEFWFLSGAGGWATSLRIRPDGSFYGLFYDGNMGETGDGYPNGTMYWSEFSGQFAEPVKVNDYSYSTRIETIDYAHELGKEEIINGTLYCYGDVYGLDRDGDILIYLPGTPMAELSEEFLSWVRSSWPNYVDPSSLDVTELPFYALNNAAQQQGFSGRAYDPELTMLDMTQDTGETQSDKVQVTDEKAAELRSKLKAAEEKEEELMKSLTEDSMSQGEMNEKSDELYKLWDGLLNEIWGVLKETLDEAAMKKLTAEEKDWIAKKEKAVADAVAEFEGGSLSGTVGPQKAAEMTRDRVYELIKLLEQ